MSEIQLMHYKQKTPEETVQFLQDILKNMKVEVTETWQERSSIGTYALRLDFRGTKIGRLLLFYQGLFVWWSVSSCSINCL